MATSKYPQYRQPGGYQSMSNAAPAAAGGAHVNGVYIPGRTGRIDAHAPGTRRPGIRNRDGTTSPQSAMGRPTGPLTPPRPSMVPGAKNPADPAGAPNEAAAGTPEAAQEDTSNGVYIPGREGRIDARPRNALYAPGTGPGTGRTGIRTGIRNRDGTTSPLSAMGSPMGPLTPPRPSMLPDTKPKPAPAGPKPASTGPLPVAATPGLPDTIKTSTQQFGSTPAQNMKPPAPLTPSVIPASPSLPSSSTPQVAPTAVTAGVGDTIKAGGMQPYSGPPTQNMKPPAPLTPSVIPASPSLPSSSTPQVTPLGVTAGGGDNTMKMNTQFRAKGGPVRAGRPYMVGEEGPELIVPRQSGTVVPNHALSFLPKGKGGRRTSGLMMRPRPMPPEYARQQQGRGRVSNSRHAR